MDAKSRGPQSNRQGDDGSCNILKRLVPTKPENHNENMRSCICSFPKHPGNLRRPVCPHSIKNTLLFPFDQTCVPPTMLISASSSYCGQVCNSLLVTNPSRYPSALPFRSQDLKALRPTLNEETRTRTEPQDPQVFVPAEIPAPHLGQEVCAMVLCGSQEIRKRLRYGRSTRKRTLRASREGIWTLGSGFNAAG